MKNLIETFGTRIKSIEILSLLNNHKLVCRQGFYDNEIKKVKKFCKKYNLVLEKSKFKIKLLDGNKEFSNKGIIANKNEIGMHFYYISKDEYLSLKAHLFEIKQDHINFGKLLGYPDCCIDFFNKNFDKNSDLDIHFIDKLIKNSKKNQFHFYTNILNRHNDFALISHFPCSFECKYSVDIGKKNLESVKKKKSFVDNLIEKYKIGKREIEFI